MKEQENVAGYDAYGPSTPHEQFGDTLTVEAPVEDPTVYICCNDIHVPVNPRRDDCIPRVVRGDTLRWYLVLEQINNKVVSNYAYTGRSETDKEIPDTISVIVRRPFQEDVAKVAILDRIDPEIRTCFYRL